MWPSVTSLWRELTTLISTSARTTAPMVRVTPPPRTTTIWLPMPKRPPVALRRRAPRRLGSRFRNHAKAA